MTENDYGKILEGLHDKILNDEEMLQKVDHNELYVLGMSICLFDFQKARVEQWKEEANKYQTLWCDAVQDIKTAQSEAIKEFAKKYKDHIRNFTGMFGDMGFMVNLDGVLFAVDFVADNLVKERAGETND